MVQTISYMRKGTLLLCLISFLASCNQSQEKKSKDKPLLYLPDDLEATLWAESPMFYNPTNMDVDIRGRIWVTEAVNYRNFNNDSTQILHHGKGDRVMILEDTDGDGKADVSKIFVQDKDLVSPLGLAVIGNKVFVSCSPHLIVYTDTDGDDIPDHKEILLTGFGGIDHDHSLHAVVGGPDGNLYFNTGNAGPHIVTDKSGWTLRSGSVYTGGSPYNTINKGNIKSDDGQVWVGGLTLRIDSQGKGMKVMAHNFRNSYEMAIDSRGDMWQNDNDDQVVSCRTSWLMEGGNAGYFSNDGTRFWQADQRPWQDVFTAHWHQDDPGVMPAGDNAGAGSPTGIVVNESEALGLKYRGMVLSADAGRNVIFGYHPQMQQSGYDLGKRLNFITSLQEDNVGYVWNDSSHNAQSAKWFRPSDVTIGTDGAIYIADWYDPVVGGHQMQDTSGYGRIYRITPKEKILNRPKIIMSTTIGQIEALKSPAVNVRFVALEKLRSQGPSIIPQVKKLLEDKNPYYQARAIWLLSTLGDQGVAEVKSLLEHKDENIRVVAFRSLRHVVEDILPYAERMSSDPSSFVRREVILALGNLSSDKSKNILFQLIEGYDGDDRWYLEALGATMKGHESEIFPKILEKFKGEESDPAKWDAKLASLVWRLHPPEAINVLKARASAYSLSEGERSKALTALAFINTPSAVKAMISLSKSENKNLAEQSAYWLSFRQNNDWFALMDWSKAGFDAEKERKVTAMKVRRSRILDEHMPLNEKKNNAQNMAQDPVGVQMLLGLAVENKLPKLILPYVEELIRKHPDPSVRIQSSFYFKNADEAKNFSIPVITKMVKNASTGERIFEKHCASCHRIKKTGQEIGPDLTLIRNKFDPKGLLNEIINPNAGIVFGYEAWTINTSDGQSFFGFLIGDGAQAVTIKDLTGKKQIIPTAKISSRKKQDRSLMPDPTALGLSNQDLADLLEYLVTLKR